MDFVFVVDVSGSMVGQPSGSGNEVIFPRVRAAVARMIAQVQSGSTVTLVPFADGVRPERRFIIETAADRQAAIQFLDSLNPDGNNTYVYRAVDDAFRRYTVFRGPRADRVAIMLVYTDGRDNGPERITMRDVVRQFGLRRQQDDWLYYVTLGVELPDADRRALEESDFATYVPSPRGAVPDVWIVRPRYPLLAFGNLKRDPAQERVLSFAVSGTAPFPTDGRLRAETDFGPLARTTGVNVEVLPGRFQPTPQVRLRLALVNEQGLPEGQYDGEIRLTSNNRNILIRPNRLRVRFTYAPPRTVQLEPPRGGSQVGRVALPELKPKHRNGPDTTSITFPLRLNDEAERSGGTFTVRLRQDTGPQKLPTNAFLLNGSRVGFGSIDLRRTRELAFGVSLRGLKVDPGTYSGKLILADGTAEVLGTREVTWRVDVVRGPIPWWEIALAILALAGVITWIWHARRPVLRGRLIVRAPADDFREIPLSGRRELRLDDEAQLVPAGSRSGRLRIVAEGVGRNSRPRVFKVVGDVSVRRSGESFDDAIQNATLADGDEVVWNQYRLAYSKS